MAQAAHLMTQLPEARQEKPIWQHAAELLMQAHQSRKAADVRAATDHFNWKAGCEALRPRGNLDDLHQATGQLRRALDVESWAA